MLISTTNFATLDLIVQAQNYHMEKCQHLKNAVVKEILLAVGGYLEGTVPLVYFMHTPIEQLFILSLIVAEAMASTE